MDTWPRQHNARMAYPRPPNFPKRAKTPRLHRRDTTRKTTSISSRPRFYYGYEPACKHNTCIARLQSGSRPEAWHCRREPAARAVQSSSRYTSEKRPGVRLLIPELRPECVRSVKSVPGQSSNEGLRIVRMFGWGGEALVNETSRSGTAMQVHSQYCKSRDTFSFLSLYHENFKTGFAGSLALCVLAISASLRAAALLCFKP